MNNSKFRVASTVLIRDSPPPTIYQPHAQLNNFIESSSTPGPLKSRVEDLSDNVTKPMAWDCESDLAGIDYE